MEVDEELGLGDVRLGPPRLVLVFEEREDRLACADVRVRGGETAGGGVRSSSLQGEGGRRTF